MSKTLYVTGKMYEANTVSITDDELKSLVAAEQSEDDFWENLEELHDQLMGDSQVNGFRVTNGVPRFEASVDEEKISLSDWDAGYSQSKIDQGKAPTLTSHVLVSEKWSDRGCWSCDLNEKFDRENLDLSATVFTLPTGEIRYVVEPYYEDHDFDYGDRSLGIPIDSELTASEQLENLWLKHTEFQASGSNTVVKELESFRFELISSIENDSTKLIKWLYENQGIRRFDASNRFFIVLVNTGNFFEGWKLKRALPLLKKATSEYLDLKKDIGKDVSFEWEGQTYQVKGDVLVIKN